VAVVLTLARCMGATEPPQGDLPHCGHAMLLFFCRRSEQTGASVQGRLDRGRHPHEPNQLAAICQHVLQQLVTGDRITPMSRNGLLLLIASLAFLVALGILTS
jgi:hypothetical protein